MLLTPLQKYSKKEQKKFIRQLTYTQPITRIKFLFRLPMNARVAEIGVADGNFSECILKINQPEKLHLIDCWEYQNDSEYQLDCNDVSQKEQERRFRFVKKRFRDNPDVKIHREYSLVSSQKFPNHYFDWIYLDANHSYRAVKEDLNAWYPKVKTDGIISGNDYTSKPYYGVIPAVDKFAKEQGLVMFLLDCDPWHSWALAKPETVQKITHYNSVNRLNINIARLFIRKTLFDYIYTMMILRLRRLKFNGRKWNYC